jgi:uncharacterized RDD family membrane protein YckC
MSWFYHQNGENKGPVTVEDLRQLRQSNQIADDTLVWQQGLPQWVTFAASNVATAPVGAVAVAAPGASAGAGLQACSECGKLFPEADMIAYEGKSICPVCKPLFFQRLREGVNQPGVLHYARVLSRFVAIFLDGILLDILVLGPVILFFGFSAMTSVGRGDIPPALNVLITLLQYLVPALYEILMIAYFGQTLGKMALKVKVVSEDGGPIGFGKSTGRYFAKILSALILCIGYLMAIWDPEKRALHDRICGTRVITVDS